MRSMADAVAMVLGLGKNAGRLEQDTVNSQCRIDLDREFRLDAKAFRAVAVPLLDPAFSVAAVTAHVPLPGGASDARLGVGPTHDADDEIAGREAAPLGRCLDRPQRFMAENEALLPRRSKAIATVENFAIGPAYPECQGAHQDGSVRLGRFGHNFEFR